MKIHSIKYTNPNFNINERLNIIKELILSGINGIELRNALSAKFGGVRDASAKYTLTVKLSEPATKRKALEQTGDAAWQEISITATYHLTETATGRVLTKGRDSASESYTFVRYLVASNASYNNAVQNTIRVLADKIGTRVIAETYRHSKQVAGSRQ